MKSESDVSCKQKTHPLASKRLVGVPVRIEEGRAEVVLRAIDEMAVDEYGLVHGGFTFGVADYAAMLAVNEPNVVIWKAECTFTKPVRVGDEMRAVAEVEEREGKRRVVSVTVRTAKGVVFEGRFTCYVPDNHVLLRRKGDER
ncbi:MAG: PaaI family thioesterase [Thermococci archaeon]|nr:PaaI family thioesterase [Thermococci archaeon]